MITKRGDIMSVQVSTRIDPVTKQQFDSVCERIGLSPSSALSVFIKGVINYNGIPFNITDPPQTPKKISMEEALGCMRGQFKMTDDFDAPLDCFKEYTP